MLLQGDINVFRATQMIQYGVAVLEKDPAILFGPRLVLDHLGGTETKAISNPFTGGVARMGEVSIGFENLAIIAGTAILCLSLYLFFRYTRLGTAMQAASQNQLAAYYVGIPVKRIYSLVWAMSAAIAAAAGILVAPVSLIEPVMGFVGIKAFAAAIVGGFGSLPGAIVGGLIVGIVEQFAGLYLPTGFADTSAYPISCNERTDTG